MQPLEVLTLAYLWEHAIRKLIFLLTSYVTPDMV